MKLIPPGPSQMIESPVHSGPIPTDYMSALARYGSLQMSSEQTKYESQILSTYKSESYQERGLPTQMACSISTGQLLDTDIWPVESHVLSGERSIYDAVSINPEERCDACLGLIKGKHLKCSLCGVTVHKSCSGMESPEVPYDSFKCDVCRGKANKAPRCHICNMTKGAMRFSSSDKVWVHCSCVFFARRAYNIAFRDPFRMTGPTGVKASVSANAGSTTCDACESSVGLLVPCSYPRCIRHLHSRCALFHEGYEGSSFSDVIYYPHDGRRKYFNFIGTFCNEHATSDYVLTAVQFYLRRSYVIRERGSSNYRKYQTEVSEMVRMTSAVAAFAYTEEDDRRAIYSSPELVMNVEPYIKGYWVKGNVYASHENTKLEHWVDFFKRDRETARSYAHSELIYNPEDDTIHIDVTDEANKSLDTLPVVDVHSATGDASLDSSSSQFRGQRMMWQKFDIFRPIPYGPYSDQVLLNLDINSRKKSVSEYANLERTVLTCSDFLEPRELGEIYMQQILLGCKGILSLLESLKADVDREINASPKNGAVPTLSERKHFRLHVLVDTGRTSGMMIFKVDRWLLGALSGSVTHTERGTTISASETKFALDEEVRHFISHVQAELVKNTYNTGMFLSSGANGAKEIDVVSGIAEYNLKDDLWQLHSDLNSQGNDGDNMRMRRKGLKKQKADISLRSMELEKFVELTPLECELLKRCTLEMSHTNEVNLKLAVMKNTVNLSPNVNFIQIVDWDSIVRHIQSSSHDGGANNSVKITSSRAMKQTAAVGRTYNALPMVAMPTVDSHLRPPVPMISLGKQTWPVVDDLNFVRCQKELTESELATVLSQLRKIRQNIRENVLEINARRPKMNEIMGITHTLLEKYEAMDRWSTLVINACRGLNDKLETAAQPTTAAIPAEPVLPPTGTPKSSDVRNAAKRAEGIVEGAYCSVCFTNTGNNLNPVYTCSRCFMSCHRNCYGVGRVGKEMDNSDYICRRCEYERRSMGSQWQTAFRSCSILCSICGRGGGALKRCDADEWAHVFCLLSLTPETSCLNYVTLEPWTLTGVAKWRRECTCAICGIHWGLVLRCDECDTTAHPLCAWLHGYKFNASSSMEYMVRMTTGEVLMKELHITVVCNEHDEKRQWSQYVTMRNRRFLNRDTAYSLFEGKDKRRKLRSLLPECLASTESLDMPSILAEIGETQHITEEKRCGICFGTGDLVDFINCRESVHYWCYVERHSETFSSQKDKSMYLDGTPDTLICDVCRNKDEGAECAICKVASGVLKQIPGTGSKSGQKRKYMHVICGVCFPETLIMLYRGNEEDNAHKKEESEECVVCHSTEGLMVTCSHEDCSIQFHAFCGISNRYAVETHCLDLKVGPQYVAYCQNHSLTSKSVGNNIKLLLRFRNYLTVLREMVNDLAAQDTVMRAWYRKKQELLNAEYPLTSLIQKQ